MLGPRVLEDEDLFWYCFRRISLYDVDGQPNLARRA